MLARWCNEYRRAAVAIPDKAMCDLEVEEGSVAAKLDATSSMRRGQSDDPLLHIRTKRNARQAMSTLKRRTVPAWFAAGVLALTVIVCADAGAQSPAVDPAAVQKLKQMFEFMDGLQQFSVQTRNVVEDLHVSGHRVDRDMSATVTVKRPNKLRAVRGGGLGEQRFFYDGKTLTLYNPGEKLYATEAAPPTVEKMIDFARETVGVVLPAADLLYRNAFPLLMQDVKLAAVVGRSVIGGVKCDHLLFSRPGVDFQVWVAEGKQPFPCKYVVTETGTPVTLSIATVFSDWNTRPAADDGQFTFVSPKGTEKIRFLLVDPPRPTGR